MRYNSFSGNSVVREDKDKYYLQGRVGGLGPKDILIEFSSDQSMTIKGRTEHNLEEGQRPHTLNGSGGDNAAESKEASHSGSKETSQLATRNTHWVSEHNVIEICQKFSFSTRVDEHNVKARIKDGVLCVVLSKLP
jgi:HSP20 family molecular chaperone IbpA